MNTKISLILLTFNRHIFLRYNLENLCMISVDGLEVIVIDNGSEISVESIVADFESRINIKLLRYSQNVKSDNLLTLAALHAEGRYYCSLDC